MITAHPSLTMFRSLGDLLRFLRRRARLSQRDLAIAVGYSESHLSRIEAGDRALDRTSLLALFVPALCIQDEPEIVTRLLALCAERTATTRGEPAHLATWHGARQIDVMGQGRLPTPLTPLIGRHTDVCAVCDLLADRQLRLLTLTGPVGVGKSRLALAVGHRLLAAYRDGVYLVELATVQDPQLVPAVIASVLGVQDAPNHQLAQVLISLLESREVLLIVDTFEHLLPATTFVVSLLVACPNLQMMVTSRARLQLYGEHEYPVAPLPVPDPGDPQAAADSPSVRLFCERAQAAQASFRLTPSLTPTIAQICRRLDGLPLAIELAAMRIRLFAPQELLQRLERCLPLLDQGAIDLSLQQQGLEQAIAWSYRLLDPVHQELLARLSVFADSFYLAAAEAVCSDPASTTLPPLDHPGPAVALGIVALLDQSLLIRQAGAAIADSAGPCCKRCPARQLRELIATEPRFTMLTIIREFARDRLRESGALPIVEQRHAAYFATWVDEAVTYLHGPEQGIWLARLERENDNLRLALNYLLHTGQLECAARMACSLGALWQRHGRYSEGRNWLERILARLPQYTLPDLLYAHTLQTAAMLAYRQGNWQTAKHELQKSLTLYHVAGNLSGLAKVLFDLGWIALDQAEWDAALRLNQESLALAREVGDQAAVYRALTNLGWARRCLGDQDNAALLFREAYELAGRLEHTRGVAVSLVNLGWIALDAGALAEALRLVQESLPLCHLLGERELLAEGLEILAATAVASGDVRRAAIISAAADGLWETLHVTRPPIQDALAVHPRTIASLHERLADSELADAWNKGRFMSVDAIAVYALHGTECAPSC